jgi:hypothetical protein
MATYIDNVISQIGKTDTCDQLDLVFTTAAAGINTIQDSISAQMDLIRPMMTPPTNPSNAVDYCKKLSVYYNASYNVMRTQLSDLQHNLNDLNAANEARKLELGCQ